MVKRSGCLLEGDYSSLRKAVEGELRAGMDRLRRTYQAELVRTYWNIGRVLRKMAGLEDKPSAANARLIARLSRDLKRRDAFFYDAAKFHRLYPDAPPDALSWTHYSLLIRLDDPQKRLALEKKAAREKISAKDLRMYTRMAPAAASTGEALLKGGTIPLERGRLYHYQASSEPFDGRIRIDAGFGIEREVRCAGETSLHAGLIVRALKEGEDYSVRIAPYEKPRLYTYRALLKRVIDGDTLLVHIDMGFRTWISQTIRLRGIDTPEVTAVVGMKAASEVKARLTPGSVLVVRTYKQEKYGRFLADVFYFDGDSRQNIHRQPGGQEGAGAEGYVHLPTPEQILEEGIFLNQELLDLGLAAAYDGGGKS